MIKVLVADDKDLNKVCSGIIENEGCILNGNVELIKTKYVKDKTFEGGDFETGEMLIKNTENLSIAILDIYFDDEFGRTNKNGGKILADLIQKYHPSCQIVIMTKSNSDPELLKDYDAFRDGRKFLSISKNHLEVDFDEYNLVFTKALEMWRRKVFSSVNLFSNQVAIVKAFRDKTNCEVLNWNIDDFRFFTDDINDILDCFVYIPEFKTSTSFYNIPPYDLFLEFYLVNYEKFISDHRSKIIADVFARIIENDFLWAKNDSMFQNANVNKNIPPEKREIYNKYHENNNSIRSVPKFPTYVYLVNKFNEEKDRFGNIDTEVLEKFEVILIQRIIYFFLFFVLHLKPNQIYNYLLNLSFEESTSEKYKQLPSQVLLIKGFDGRSLGKLDGKEDYRNKRIPDVLLQYTSYELEQMLKVFSQLIDLYNSDAIKNNPVANIRLTQIITHIKTVLVKVSPAV